MNICDDCPNSAEVERRRQCFDCVGGDEPLDTEVEIANAPQQPQERHCSHDEWSSDPCTGIKVCVDCGRVIN